MTISTPCGIAVSNCSEAAPGGSVGGGAAAPGASGSCQPPSRQTRMRSARTCGSTATLDSVSPSTGCRLRRAADT